jgi:hypothetical protein
MYVWMLVMTTVGSVVNFFGSLDWSLLVWLYCCLEVGWWLVLYVKVGYVICEPRIKEIVIKKIRGQNKTFRNFVE